MTELGLCNFCKKKELDWRGSKLDKLIIWLSLSDIEEFLELVGESFFGESGYTVNLQYKQIAFDLVPICRYFNIEPTNVRVKEV